jgi:HEAT repeat protein
MSKSLILALAVLAVPILATVGIWLALDSGDDGTEDGDALTRGPGGYTRPGLAGTGTTADGAGAGTGTAGTPGGSNGLIGSRIPSGVDLTDPVQVQQLLEATLTEVPPNWPRLARLVELTQGRLDDRTRTFVLDALRAGDRVGALSVLQVAQDGTLVDDLFRMLDEPGGSPAVRQAILQALGTLPGADDRDVVRGLESRLTGELRQDLLALQSISRRGGREAARAVVTYLENLDDPKQMPNLAFLRIDLAKDEEAAQVVLDAFERAQSEQALTALIMLASQPGAESFTETLIGLDREGQPDAIRREALQGLGRVGSAEAVTHLLRAAQGTGDTATVALTTVGRMVSASEEGRDQLLETLSLAQRDPTQARTRLEVLRALGNLREERAIAPMAEAVQSGDRDLAIVASRGLGRMGSAAREHIGTLLDAYSTGDDTLRRTVAVSLGGIGGTEARNALQQMLDDETMSASLKRTVRMSLTRLTRAEEDAERAAAGTNLQGTAGPR